MLAGLKNIFRKRGALSGSDHSVIDRIPDRIVVESASSQIAGDMDRTTPFLSSGRLIEYDLRYLVSQMPDILRAQVENDIPAGISVKLPAALLSRKLNKGDLSISFGTLKKMAHKNLFKEDNSCDHKRVELDVDETRRQLNGEAPATYDVSSLNLPKSSASDVSSSSAQSLEDETITIQGGSIHELNLNLDDEESGLSLSVPSVRKPLVLEMRNLESALSDVCRQQIDRLPDGFDTQLQIPAEVARGYFENAEAKVAWRDFWSWLVPAPPMTDFDPREKVCLPMEYYIPTYMAWQKANAPVIEESIDSIDLSASASEFHHEEVLDLTGGLDEESPQSECEAHPSPTTPALSVRTIDHANPEAVKSSDSSANKNIRFSGHPMTESPRIPQTEESAFGDEEPEEEISNIFETEAEASDDQSVELDESGSTDSDDESFDDVAGFPTKESSPSSFFHTSPFADETEIEEPFPESDDNWENSQDRAFHSDDSDELDPELLGVEVGKPISKQDPNSPRGSLFPANGATTRSGIDRLRDSSFISDFGLGETNDEPAVDQVQDQTENESDSSFLLSDDDDDNSEIFSVRENSELRSSLDDVPHPAVPDNASAQNSIVIQPKEPARTRYSRRALNPEFFKGLARNGTAAHASEDTENATAQLARLFLQPEKRVWTTDEVIQKAAMLENVTGVIVSFEDGLLVGAQVGDGVDSDEVSRKLPALFQAASQLPGAPIHQLPDHIAMEYSGLSVHVFQAQGIFLMAFVQAHESAPVKQLKFVTNFLSRKLG